MSSSNVARREAAHSETRGEGMKWSFFQTAKDKRIQELEKKIQDYKSEMTSPVKDLTLIKLYRQVLFDSIPRN